MGVAEVVVAEFGKEKGCLDGADVVGILIVFERRSHERYTVRRRWDVATSSTAASGQNGKRLQAGTELKAAVETHCEEFFPSRVRSGGGVPTSTVAKRQGSVILRKRERGQSMHRMERGHVDSTPHALERKTKRETAHTTAIAAGPWNVGHTLLCRRPNECGYQDRSGGSRIELRRRFRGSARAKQERNREWISEIELTAGGARDVGSHSSRRSEGKALPVAALGSPTRSSSFGYGNDEQDSKSQELQVSPKRSRV